MKALAECAPPEAGASTIGVGAGGTIGGGGGGLRPRERGGAAAPRWEACRCSSRVGDDVCSRVAVGTIGRTSQSAETGTCRRELDAPVAAWRRTLAGAAVAERLGAPGPRAPCRGASSALSGATESAATTPAAPGTASAAGAPDGALVTGGGGADTAGGRADTAGAWGA